MSLRNYAPGAVAVLRTRPEENAPAVGDIFGDEEVTVLGGEGKWALVQYRRNRGHVLTGWLEPEKQCDNPYQPARETDRRNYLPGCGDRFAGVDGLRLFFSRLAIGDTCFRKRAFFPGVRGFGSALVSIPGGIAIGLITAGVFLKTGRSDKEAD